MEELEGLKEHGHEKVVFRIFQTEKDTEPGYRNNVYIYVYMCMHTHTHLCLCGCVLIFLLKLGSLFDFSWKINFLSFLAGNKVMCF